MVFRPQLEPLVEGGLRDVGSCSTRLPLDDLIARAREFHGDAAVARIEILEGGNGATTIRFADKQGVYVDPCTGSVLGQQHQWGGFFGSVEQLHRLLFIDDADIAEFIGGSTSLVLALVTVIGGLIVWWPPNLKALKSARSLRPGRDSTPLETSTPYGRTVRIASATFSARRPPARVFGKRCFAS